MEIRTALLYGAGFKEIWLKLLQLPAGIMIPVGGIIGVLPKLKSYHNLYMYSRDFPIKRSADALLGNLAKGMTAGLALAVIMSAAIAWSIWRKYRNSFQQSAETINFKKASV